MDELLQERGMLFLCHDSKITISFEWFESVVYKTSVELEIRSSKIILVM